MDVDRDSQMLSDMGCLIVDLMVRFRESSLKERVTLRPSLNELLKDWADYQVKLLKEGIITTKEDLTALRAIKAEIDKAANKQKAVLAIARLIAFIVGKI